MSGMVRLVSTWQNVMNLEIDVGVERERERVEREKKSFEKYFF